MIAPTSNADLEDVKKLNLFKYVKVSERVVHGIIQSLQNGDSVVLLGPRYSGKQYILDEVATALKQMDEARVVEVRLPGNRDGKKQMKAPLCEALHNVLADLDWKKTG